MDATVLRVIRTALGVITDRLITILCLFMTFGLAVWAMHDPDWMRQAMAAFFAVFVFLPVLWRDKKGTEHEEANS